MQISMNTIAAVRFAKRKTDQTTAKAKQTSQSALDAIREEKKNLVADVTQATKREAADFEKLKPALRKAILDEVFHTEIVRGKAFEVTGRDILKALKSKPKTMLGISGSGNEPGRSIEETLRRYAGESSILKVLEPMPYDKITPALHRLQDLDLVKVDRESHRVETTIQRMRTYSFDYVSIAPAGNKALRGRYQ